MFVSTSSQAPAAIPRPARVDEFEVVEPGVPYRSGAPKLAATLIRPTKATSVVLSASMPAKRGRPREKSESFTVFEKNVRRSRAFIRVFDQGRARGAPTNDEKELLRGALVFAIGALDNFMHELVLEIVPKFGGDKGAMKRELTLIAKEDPGLALRVALSGPDGAAEFRDALDQWLEGRSFHGVKQIKNALGYVGVQLDESMLPSGWDRKLEAFTENRHKIVHRGSTSGITRDRANECTDLIEQIGRVINQQVVTKYHR